MIPERVDSAPVVVTQGDPDGIGPELLLQVAAAGALGPGDRVVADPLALDRAARIQRPWAAAGRAAIDALLDPCPALLDPCPALLDPCPAQAAGASQVAALERGVDRVLAEPGSALVTAPIDKQVCQRAGFAYPGHTEYLAARAGVGDDFAMFLVGPRLRVALATIHLPLARVPGALTSAAIERVGRLVVQTLQRDFGMSRPRVAVLGLNPHAGEGGTLGCEDDEIVAPAVQALQDYAGAAAVITGPLPADAGLPAHARGEFDAVVAMYHDQGLAAFKVLHFADGVNVTLGLPFVRCSPDHGTAKDIAGQGRADPSSMLAAIALARTLTRRRR